jgi:hypothetical protein
MGILGTPKKKMDRDPKDPKFEGRGERPYWGYPGAHEILVSWQPELLGKTKHGPRQQLEKKGFFALPFLLFSHLPTSFLLFHSSLPQLSTLYHFTPAQIQAFPRLL